MPIFVALSSNLDHPRQRVLEAFDAIANHPQLQLLRRSSVFRTKPWGYTEQPDFFNAVCEISTDLKPRELLRVLRQLEIELGRQPSSIRWGPRRIDLDLLLYHGEQINEPQLQVPHPYMRERAFVLVPLLEIAPDLIDPATQAPYSIYLGNVKCEGDVVLVE